MSTRARPARPELLGLVMICFAVLAIVEVFAFAPASAWVDERIWLVQGLATGIVALVVWVVALVVEYGLCWVQSARRSVGNVGVWLVTAVVGLPELWELARAGHSFPGGMLRLVSLIALLAVTCLAIHRVARRVSISAMGVGIALAAILATPMFVRAARQSLQISGGYASARPFMLALIGLYGLVSLGMWLWGGTRRVAWMGAVLLCGVLLLRGGTTNPFDLHILERSAPRAALGPPVLLIVLDTFRGDAVELTPATRSRTPSLARFANEADVYTNAIANGSWTLPAHASLFTGQPLVRHRTDATPEPTFGSSLPPELPTVQEILRAQGYGTSCIAANGLIGPRTGLSRGFQRYRHPSRQWLDMTLPIRLHDIIRPKSMAWIYTLIVQLTGLNVNAQAEEIVDHALEEMEGNPHSLYLFLNFMDTHSPYPAPRGEPTLARLAYCRDTALASSDRALAGRAWPYVEVERVSYGDQVQRLDRALGRLFDALRRSGWYDAALIVLTADHGQALWENPGLNSYYGHHGAYEPVVRIPMMVKRPGQRQGSVSNHYVQQTDILPTLLRAVGVAPIPGMYADGLEVNARRQPTVTEWYPRRNGPPHLLPWSRFALYRSHYKYVLENGSREYLFDLDQSPFESVDVIDRQPAFGRALHEELVANLASASREGGTRPRLDREMEEQLRGLGYVN